MSITEILQFADKLVFSHTGKHLDHVQEAVVKGVWEGKTYAEIGEKCHRSEGRVRDVGYKLWKILSESLGEDINKSNFSSTLERLKLTSSPILIQNNNVNFCSYYQLPNNGTSSEVNHQSLSSSYHNLKQSPKITKFYGRTTEISTLSQWLENQNTRLISVLGITGIGKSTLVKYFIDTHTLAFDAIIWKNLKLSTSLDSILTELLTEVKQTNQSLKIQKPLNQALELFTQKRCLIILDNVQEIFTTQQFAGRYQPEYKDYQTFFQMITEIEHQSCIILISQEKCQEMISLDTELSPSHCLELFGLREFDPTHYPLKKGNFEDEEAWLELINLYEGNPKFLQSVNTLIKDVFDGDVSEFIKEDCLILTEDIKSIFDSIWRRLAEVEKNMLLEWSKQNQPMSRDDIKQFLSLSSPEIINGLQSLNKRFLLTPLSSHQKLFSLSAVLRKYLKLFTTT
ncbi:MAG: AAA family ATPase [Microcoleus sp.]